MQPTTGAERVRTTRDIDHQIAAACRDCNSNFFNELQAACEPLLKRAVFGESMLLDSADKQRLAAWAYKTALLLPLVARPRQGWEASVGAKCREFYARRRPPVGTRIWLGHYDLSSKWPEMVNRVDVSQAVLAEAFTGTNVLLTVGHLLLSTLYWADLAPNIIPFEQRRFPAERFVALWPVNVGVSPWPLPAYEYDELDGLSDWTEPQG